MLCSQTKTAQTLKIQPLKTIATTTFTVKDTNGNTIVAVAPGLSYQVYLIDNTTENGTWRSALTIKACEQALPANLALHRTRSRRRTCPD